MNKTVYTIGHSNHSIEEFINILKLNAINCVCDVRSSPFSRFVPHFNREILKRELTKNSILYIELGKEFGARRTEPHLKTNGIVDFAKVATDESFLNGIERVKKGIAQGYHISFLCSEKDPIDCHRNILVARNLQKHNIKIIHILYDGSLESNDITEKRLIERFISKDEILYVGGLFEPFENNQSSLLDRAYSEANKKIGYRTGDEDE
jgi:uncharacterized protein (DUF488 family)